MPSSSRAPSRVPVVALLAFAAAVGTSAGAPHAAPTPSEPWRLPWREAGLTAEQAAAHLLDRFAFGARPGEVARVAALGPEVWLERQLAGTEPETALGRKLAPLRSLDLDAEAMLAEYPPRALVRRRAEEVGMVVRSRRADGADEAPADDAGRGDDGENAALRRFARAHGMRAPREAVAELQAQKLLRAVYAENQLREVLTDFWFNHFNVSVTKNLARPFVLAFERDAVRPRVLGPFRDLLAATARHPAMLLFLDNAESTAEPGVRTTRTSAVARVGWSPAARLYGRRLSRDPRRPRDEVQARRPRGVNENYGRELLELHTLGVDGGYTQEDVVEVARAFTGWTIYPPAAWRARARVRADRALRAGVGFVVDGDFLFRADAHDAEAKTVLGHVLPAGRGLADGEDVLTLLAAHPATARHLAQKLAVRFVSDTPPPGLVERLARTFAGSGGDLAQVIRALAAAPEFWAAAARQQKIKSPFEVAVSALRALGADVDDPDETLRWVARMGQRLYACQAPTGWPDRASQWVNSGALLTRMSFGLQLAAGRVGGVRLDLARLDGGLAAESQGAALAAAARLLLPGRDTAGTVRELTPLLGTPALARRLAAPAPPEEAVAAPGFEDADDMAAGAPRPGARAGGRRDGMGRGRLEAVDRETRALADLPAPTPLAEVVGLLLGSPEFQRR